MTLVLSLATNDCLYQISDRRLTRPDGTVTTDEENKATLVHGRMVFGYSGLAMIDNKPTDQWFAFTAGDAHQNDLQLVLDYVRGSATTALADESCLNKYKRVAFVGVGWARLSEGAALTAIDCTVTNAQTEDGRWLYDALPQFFNINRIMDYSSHGFEMFPTGVALGKSDWKETWRTMDSCIQHKPEPEAIVYALARCMYKLADRDSRIGKSLMAVSLPRAVVERGEQGVRAAVPTLDAACCVYIPQSSDPQKLVWYGPNVVGPTGTIGGVRITGSREPSK